MGDNAYVRDQEQTQTNGTRRPPGYAEIDELSTKEASDEAWTTFIRKILKIDGWKIIAVQEVVRQGRWRTAANPIGYMKTASIRQANKMELRDDKFKAPPDRSRRCSCGYTTQLAAIRMGHTCVAGEVGSISDITFLDNVWSVRARHSYDDASGSATLHDTAMDLLLHAHEMCNGSDCYEPFSIYEDGHSYFGSDSLRLVNSEFIKLVPGKAPDEDGVALVDWYKLATAIGLDLFEARVLDLRYVHGFSRKMLFDSAKSDDKVRLRYQAAWKTIDRHQDQIRDTLRQKRTGLTTTKLQVAPPLRRREMPMPERLRTDDSESLRSLNDRFAVAGSKKELLWGQNLRSGRRY